MGICFDGIGQAVATFLTKDKLLPGMAVTLTGSGEVGLGEDGEPLCGVTVGAARGGAVAVQIGGVVKVSYAGVESFDVGYAALACGSEGKVTAGGKDGVSRLVLAADKDEHTVVIKL